MNRTQRRKQEKAEQQRMKAILLQGTDLEKLNCGAALQKKKQFKEALRYYDNVLRENPNHVDALYLKGGVLVQLEEFSRATKWLKKCLNIQEDVSAAHHNLGYAYLELGEFDLAEKHLSRAYELNPEKAATKFYLEMAQKRNNNKSSPDYIKQLYEAGATKFEELLVGNLKYNAPKKLMDSLNRYLTSPAKKVLDLGCGTGLMGVELAPYCEEIVGVDIAENMVREARKKNCYSELLVTPIDDYLENTNASFDMITAADVFIYLGPLETTFAGMKKRLEKGGLLGFTTEKLGEDEPEDTWLNEDTNRYRYKDSYIRRLADEYGFEVLSLEGDVSRYENKKPVPASYVILRRV